MGPLLPPEKIAPKIKIKMIGKTSAKKNPVLFRRYSRRKIERSEKIRLKLTMLSHRRFHNFPFVFDRGTDKFDEHVFQCIADHYLSLPRSVFLD